MVITDKWIIIEARENRVTSIVKEDIEVSHERLGKRCICETKQK